MPVKMKRKRIFPQKVKFSDRNQIKAVSHERFTDANVLFSNKRYNGAIYMGGFVIECLLKCALWHERETPGINRLFYTSHELDKLLFAHVSLHQKMARDGIYEKFSQIIFWNVEIRYMSRRLEKEDAEDFMRKLKGVREWLLRHI